MQNSSILLVIEGTYPWYRGGVSEWVAQYLRAFGDYRFTILQIATDEYRTSKVNNALYEIPSNVENFIRVPPPEIGNHWQTDSQKWLQSIRGNLTDRLRTADFVHVANTGFAGWLGVTLAEELKKPLVLTEHALYWKEVDMGAVALECGYTIPQDKGAKSNVVALFRSIARQVYSASDVIFSVSNCNLPEQKKLGAISPINIPNGVDSSWIKSWKSYEGKFTIGWIGRCAAMKNPLKFFEFADAMGERAEYIMMLCDAGEEELKRKVNRKSGAYPNVQLIWNRPAIEHVDEMDALCITSHNESQPLVLFEALSRKVLPIGWEAGDVTERYGIIVKKDTAADALATRVHDLWSKKERWEKEVRKRFRYVEQEHTWQNIFDRYKTVFSLHLT